MKLKWLVLILTFFTSACSSPGEDGGNATEDQDQGPEALHIDFQAGFYQDTVILFHGKEKIYEKVLTTEEGKELTDKLSIPKSEISDTIKFKVAQGDRVLKGYIPPRAEQYIGFYLSSGTVVNIYSKSTPFTY